MRVLFIATQYPYPKDNGKKIILASMLEYFIHKYGSKNVEYILVGNEKGEEKPKIKVKQFIGSNNMNKVKNILIYSGILQKKSIQESVLYSNLIAKDIKQYINQSNFDIVIYDTIRVSQMFEKEKNNNTREFVYLDDLFSVRYANMLRVMNEFPGMKINTLGNFAKQLPNVAQKLVSFELINKLLLKFEKKIIYKREIYTARNFKNTLLISQNEVEVLKERANVSTIKSIRPIVSGEEIKYSRDFKGNPSFIFLGALNIPHNNVSITYFIKNNIETLIEKIPDVKLLIVGKNADQELIKLSKNYKDNIKIMGYVEDLDKLFNEACAMIIPLLFGSGVKLKTIEALSRGLPVISTDFGVEGIDLPNKGEYIKENDLNKYAYHMKQLCDEQVNLEMSRLAYDFYVRNYSKEAVFAQYEKVFEEK